MVREKLDNRRITSTSGRRLGERRKENFVQSSSMARPRNQNGEKTSRKIESGWLNFCNGSYQQVRTRHGGGTRHVTAEEDSTVEQILARGKDLFFPNGLSTKGDAADFTFSICDLKKPTLPLVDTVGYLYEQTKLKMLHFYICTKSAEFSSDGGSESDAAKSSPDVRETLEEEPKCDHATTDENLPIQQPASKRSRRLSPLPDSSEVPSVNRAVGDEEDTLLWDGEYGTLEDDEVIIINWNSNNTGETEVLVHTDVAVPNTSSHG
ncbi:uncharacterized protein LOC115422417 [Sphaeramia orbicularis]|uniref:uncharacterized protein LOC115422417 n=1 Tax=Sphaeramia orbicularis TaxID=375764 RepID=UPI00117E7AD5|nr:uncharacterized protein LOC115422417 [Sphaeramia orbicularis]